VISIILSPFQEVKKTDANHVDTLVSKILFKTLGYVAQVLYMPRLLLPPLLPIFLFIPQSFCCRFVICGLNYRYSSVVDPDPEVQTLNLSIFGNLYQQKAAIVDSDYIPYTVYREPVPVPYGRFFAVTFVILFTPWRNLGSIPDLDPDPMIQSRIWIRNKLFRIPIHNTLLSLLFSLIVNLLIFLLQFPASVVSI
jgi:hypothetical protein